MTARDQAAKAAIETRAILAAAERRILTVMTTEAAHTVSGAVTPLMGRRNVSTATAAELGAATARLRQVYDTAVRDVTGKRGPLPDAPSQLATAVLTAQKDADSAFKAVLAAAVGGSIAAPLPPPSSPYRRVVDKAAKQDTPGKAATVVLDTISARGLTGWVSYTGRRVPLAAYGAKVVKAATVKLARMPVLSEITARRDTLLEDHAAAVAAAWGQAAAGVSVTSTVSAFLADSRLASSADPAVAKRWRQEAASSAVAGLASTIQRSDGYAALTAALGGMVLGGMAEGQADAMLLAAQKQDVAGFSAAAAYTAAAAQLRGNYGITRQAQETAASITASITAAVARALATAPKDASGGDLEDAARDALGGGNVLSRGIDWGLWTALGLGAMALYQKVAAQQFTGEGLLVDWLDSASACVLCSQNAAGSPYAPADVPPYPGHSNCRCYLVADADIPLSMLSQFAGLDI